MRVAVIGGGIIGCATAYYLQCRDIDTIVFERDTIGSGSTPRAGGGIREQFTTPESITLSQESIKVWREFESEFNTNINYRRTGYLYLARTEETAENIRQNIEIYDQFGVPSQYTSPEEATQHCPGLNPDKYVGGSYCPTDGYADSERALQGFAISAIREGANFRIGRRVTDIDSQEDKYIVHTDQEAAPFDYIVNAAGAWAPQIAAMVGTDLAITPSRRQLVIAKPEQPFDSPLPFVTDLDSGSYFRRRNARTVLVGGHFEPEIEAADPDHFDQDYESDWAEVALEKAADVSTRLDDASACRGWAGLYALTPDHHPIIEETLPKFVNACGFSGHGFMQSPATGQLVSELIADGETSLMDISRLTNDRFERREELHETFYSA